MRYLGDDEATQMKGIGLYQGTDGNLYEWVEGVDAWGDSIGFWQGVSQPEDSALSGLGALYQAPDGTLYQMHGLAEGAETGTSRRGTGGREGTGSGRRTTHEGNGSQSTTSAKVF